ncbi:cytochrome P450 [Paenibacillus sp. SORGH_AS306]|uniref:cytochrome P450 n=1 Tax=unclassified Paenibacillus TaxID=185978 RepID=UPI002782BB4A|nr:MULTISPECIES: cytochrome P450 [unclassified Paenibacillus]MDQ1235465.1 cytochrome P450 [Paenibacillus sp. SORGH_AS_0306]MDR6112514.1 cytochrome P450 [Paenibacillus sp. SORGH_AS_0338]
MNQATKKYANYIPIRELAAIESQLSPFTVYDEMREQTPVRYDENRKCWDVFRYEDVQYVLKNPKLFSSQRNRANESMLTTDPPKHKQLRDLVNQAFTPRAIEALAPRIQEIADDLLSSHLAKGQIRMVHDLATPLPVIVIAELIGVPTSDRDKFKEWSDVQVKGARDDSDEAFQELMAEKAKNHEELSNYFTAIMEQRRVQPEDDLISLLLAAEIDGQKLTDKEIVGFCILLLAAGNETTTNLITNGVRILAEQPQLQEQLREHPEMIQTAVEETLRYYPPIVAIGRVAKETVELGGQTIQAGDQVISWVGSANRDEQKFADADTFVPNRKPNQHMGFGFGIHFCLGAPLARLEGRVVLQTLLNHMEHIQLVPDTTLQPIQSAFVFGVKEYPITFTPRNTNE